MIPIVYWDPQTCSYVRDITKEERLKYKTALRQGDCYRTCEQTGWITQDYDKRDTLCIHSGVVCSHYQRNEELE